MAILSGYFAYCLLQGIKFKVIGPPSSQDVIDACAQDAVRYTDCFIFELFLYLYLNIGCFLVSLYNPQNYESKTY